MDPKERPEGAVPDAEADELEKAKAKADQAADLADKLKAATTGDPAPDPNEKLPAAAPDAPDRPPAVPPETSIPQSEASDGNTGTSGGLQVGEVIGSCNQCFGEVQATAIGTNGRAAQWRCRSCRIENMGVDDVANARETPTVGYKGAAPSSGEPTKEAGGE